MTGRNTQDLDRYGQAAMGLFSPELVLDHGLGAHVWDVDGREYLDLLAGIAVNAVGHAHPDWVKAVAQQAGRMAHVSNLFTTEPQIQLAETLLQMCGVADAGGRVFLANSGTEANEAALKLALRAGGGKRIVAAEGAFHGRTLGALSVTHKEAYRRPFHDFTGQVDFLPFGDLAALEAQLAKGDVAALWLEPIQGEAGVRPLPAGYLAKARELTTRHGALLILDEIQSGSGRTGTFLASQNPAVTGTGTVVPDVVTLAKGLGGGFPIGACVAMNPGTATALVPGDHGTTFGGNPLACAAALATCGIIRQEGLMDHAAQLGATWAAELAAVPGVSHVRGAGLLLGVVLNQPVAGQVRALAQEAGFLVNAPAPDVIRLAPPLVLTQAQAATFTAALPALIQEA